MAAKLRDQPRDRRSGRAQAGLAARPHRSHLHHAGAMLALLVGGSVAAAAQEQMPPPSAQTNTPRPTPAPSIGPFRGGVPSGPPATGTLSLSIADALKRALEHNLGLLLSSDSVDRARGAQIRAQGDLLPNVTTRISETRQQINLAAFGFPLPAGIPSDRRPVQRVRRPAVPVASPSSTSRRSTTPARRRTTSPRPATNTRARAISSCSSRRCLRRRRWPRRRAPTRRGRSCDTARGPLQPGGRPQSRAAWSPASRCCGRRSSSPPSGSGSPRRRRRSRKPSCSSRA